MQDCPEDCPNRKPDEATATARGKFASYFFALIVTGFLSFQCLSYERRDEPVPVLLWMPALLLIGGALGVNIEPGAIASVLTIRKT